MSAGSKVSYPFVPKSTAGLIAGQFWSIPLSDGSFGCGRVIELKPKDSFGARVTFLAAVLDWHGNQSPTSEAIAGARCLEQGEAHIKTIAECGGSVVGYRALESDNIEPWEFRGAECHVNSYVFKGVRRLRAQQPDDAKLPVRRVWGVRVPVVIVEKRFLGKSI